MLRHIRQVTQEYIVWREAVLARDDFTCQNCGSKEDLQAHHIIPVNENPDFSFVVTNGVTICKKCHRQYHSNYGNGVFIEYNKRERIPHYRGLKRLHSRLIVILKKYKRPFHPFELLSLIGGYYCVTQIEKGLDLLTERGIVIKIDPCYVYSKYLNDEYIPRAEVPELEKCNITAVDGYLLKEERFNK